MSYLFKHMFFLFISIKGKKAINLRLLCILTSKYLDAICCKRQKCGKRRLTSPAFSSQLFLISAVSYACFSTFVNFSAILSSSSTVFSIDWMQINSYFPW